MKIRNKLLLAFSLYLFFATAFGFFAYRELGTITKSLKYVETADDIGYTLLEVRRFEKNYYLFRNDRNFRELIDQLTKLKSMIDAMHNEFIKELGERNYALMKKTINEYDSTIQEVSEIFTEQHRHIISLSDYAERIEQELPGNNLTVFHKLRGHERDFLFSRDAEAYARFRETAMLLSLAESRSLQRYVLIAERLSVLFEREESLTESLRSKAREIQSFTKSLSHTEREKIAKVLDNSLKLLLISFILIIVLGSIVNMRVAADISNPLRELQEAAKNIASEIELEPSSIEGKDEIASLQIAFSDMEIRLHETLNSLDLAIKNLHEKQRQLVETEKLASLGTLSAGVAHEINNPLAIINEKAGLMQDMIELSGDFPQKDRFMAIISAIQHSVDRCRTITHRLLGFARGMDANIELFDLHSAIEDVLGFVSQELALKGVYVQRCFSDSPLSIESDRTQLEQILLNIIKNAIDAMHGGGSIAIGTETNENQMAVITISDTGAGILPERINRIFEPFFTTKDKGKGTGLGLSITYGIVKRLGGEISVTSELGIGTTFTVMIPLKPKAALMQQIKEGG